jgi:hypothetical protein
LIAGKIQSSVSLLEEAYRFMVARMAAASKCREKCKKPEEPILVGDPKETPFPYVPLYPPLPLTFIPLLHPLKGKQHQMRKTQQQICLQDWAQEVLEPATTPPFSGPINLMLTLSPPVFTP